MNRLFSLSIAIASLLAVPSGALANNHVASSQSTSNVVINDAFNWVVIRSATVNLLAFFDPGSHGCVASASADVYWSGGGAAETENRYRFVVIRNNTNPVTGLSTERTLSMVDHAGVNDPNYYPVSTTGASGGLTSDNGAGGTGAHTFYLLGRKVAPEDPNVTVADASLSVICVDTN
jgi:hypothetical protein